MGQNLLLHPIATYHGRCPIHPREAFGSDDKFYSSPIPLSSRTP